MKASQINMNVLRVEERIRLLFKKNRQLNRCLKNPTIMIQNNPQKLEQDTKLREVYGMTQL